MRQSVTETCFPIHPVQFWSVGISFVDIGLVLEILVLTSPGNTSAHYRVCGRSDCICLLSPAGPIKQTAKAAAKYTQKVTLTQLEYNFELRTWQSHALSLSAAVWSQLNNWEQNRSVGAERASEGGGESARAPERNLGDKLKTALVRLVWTTSFLASLRAWWPACLQIVLAVTQKRQEVTPTQLSCRACNLGKPPSLTPFGVSLFGSDATAGLGTSRVYPPLPSTRPFRLLPRDQNIVHWLRFLEGEEGNGRSIKWQDNEPSPPHCHKKEQDFQWNKVSKDQKLLHRQVSNC